MRCLSVFIAAVTLLAGDTAGAAPITIDAAVILVRSQVGDRVLRAKPGMSTDGREVYLVRLLREDGGMYTLEVDAESGSMKEIATGPLIVPRGVAPADENQPAPQDVDPCAS